jgi:hypothetical protein
MLLDTCNISSRKTLETKSLIMSKLHTVFGATGQQGGSLIDYVLGHPELSKLYHLRGISRDASKESAASLRKRGVEVIQADLSDPQSLVAAVADSYAIFGVTNCMYPSCLNSYLQLIVIFKFGTKPLRQSRLLKGRQSQSPQ